MHSSANLKFPPLSVLSQTGRMLSFVFTRSDCHLTIITLTLIHWITIDHVPLKMIKIDSLGTVRYSSRPSDCPGAATRRCYAGAVECKRVHAGTRHHACRRQ